MDFIINQNGADAELINVMIGGFLQKFYVRGAKPDNAIARYQ